MKELLAIKNDIAENLGCEQEEVVLVGIRLPVKNDIYTWHGMELVPADLVDYIVVQIDVDGEEANECGEVLVSLNPKYDSDYSVR